MDSEPFGNESRRWFRSDISEAVEDCPRDLLFDDRPHGFDEVARGSAVGEPPGSDDDAEGGSSLEWPFARRKAIGERSLEDMNGSRIGSELDEALAIRRGDGERPVDDRSQTDLRAPQSFRFGLKQAGFGRSFEVAGLRSRTSKCSGEGQPEIGFDVLGTEHDGRGLDRWRRSDGRQERKALHLFDVNQVWWVRLKEVRESR